MAVYFWKVASSSRLMWREMPGFFAVFLGAGAYLLLAPSHILGGDNGEFVALMHSPGIAHPPGYPLYVLYLRMMSWIPGELARSASLATALLGSVQLMLLYIGARFWCIPALAAGIAVAVYAASPLALHLNSQAEVFALNGVIAAAIVLLAGEDCPLKKTSKILLNGLIFGLGFSHHHSIVFLLPLVIHTAASAARGESLFRSGHICKALVLTALAFAVGLLPNLLLIAWSHADEQIFYSWSPIYGLDGLFHHFLRRDFGTFQLAQRQGSIDVVGQELWLLDSLWWTWTLLLPCAVLGLCLPLVHQTFGSRRWWRSAALLACVIASGPLFVSRFNIPLQSAPGPALLERFHLLPALLLVIPSAYGLATIAERVRNELLRYRSADMPASSLIWSRVATALIVVCSFNFSFRLSQSRVQDRHASDVHLALLNGLRSIPSDSLVVLRSDHGAFGYAALQAVAKKRRDITFLIQPLWVHSWYRKRFLADAGGEYVNVFELMDATRVSGRRVYVDQSVWRDATPHERHRLGGYQQGLFRRLLSPGERPPSPERLLKANESLFASFEFPSNRLERTDGWPFWIRAGYTEAWLAIAEELRLAGRRDLARIALRHSFKYGPCLNEPCPTF